MLERLLFNTVPTDLFLECEDDDIDSYTDETTAFSCMSSVITQLQKVFMTRGMKQS